jgi:hypothetical protein
MIEVRNRRLLIKDLPAAEKIIVGLSEIYQSLWFFAETENGAAKMEDAVNSMMVENGLSHLVITIALINGVPTPIWSDTKANYFI